MFPYSKAAKPWFVKQDRAPKDGKIYAFQTALNNCGDAQSIDRLLATNIKTYAYILPSFGARSCFTNQGFAAGTPPLAISLLLRLSIADLT